MQTGEIIDVKQDGTVLIKAKIDVNAYIRKKIEKVNIEYIDGRTLSDKQRRMCYALLRAIAEWSGNTPKSVKEALKLEFWSEQVERLEKKIFSLSNAPMDLIVAFQKFLVEFIIENDVPTKFPLLDYVDDIDSYVYACLINKKCVVCGRKAELHHIDAIGMGNDRTEVNHMGREALSLCRGHHTEIHTLGRAEFLQKYHLNGGIEIDKTIAKIYKLKGDKNEQRKQ